MYSKTCAVGLCAIIKDFKEIPKELMKFILTALLGDKEIRIFYNDEQGNITYGNKAFQTRYHLEADFFGQSISNEDLYDTRYCKSATEIEQKVIKEGKIDVSVERQVLNKNRVSYSLTIRIPKVDSQKKVTGILGVSIDITEYELANSLNVIKQSIYQVLSQTNDVREVFRMVLDILIKAIQELKGGGVYLLKEDGSLFLDYSAGLSADFLAGKSHYLPDSLQSLLVRKGEVVYAEYAELLKGVGSLRQATATEEIHSIAVIPIKIDGVVRACLNFGFEGFKEIPRNIRSILEESANIIGESIKQKQELLHRDEIEMHNKSMEELGSLAAEVAHNSNNLLTGILGYAQILMLTNSEEERMGNIEYIISLVRAAEEMNNSILYFGRKSNDSYKKIDLNKVIKTLEVFLKINHKKNFKINLELAAELVEVFTDENQLKQMIFNLIKNAKEALPLNGGEIFIKTENRVISETDQLLSFDKKTITPGNYARLIVEDNGMGMSEDTLKKIFKRFFSTKGELGNGLGLASMKKAMDDLGGFITVSSQIGRGTIFCLYFPIIK